jgi:hypothetical protein
VSEALSTSGRGLSLFSLQIATISRLNVRPRITPDNGRTCVRSVGHPCGRKPSHGPLGGIGPDAYRIANEQPAAATAPTKDTVAAGKHKGSEAR